MATPTFTYLDPDQAPVTQQGVCTEYPAGYGGTPVHWIGALSQIVDAASGVKVKIPEGFQPKRYVVKTEAIVPPVFLDGIKKPKELVSGDVALLTMSGAGIVTSGYLSGTSSGGTPMIAGDYVTASGGAAEVVDDDNTYVTIVGSGTISGDVMTEVLVYCDIVDPHPPKMF